MLDSSSGFEVLRLATVLVDAAQAGVSDAGFDDLRPAHGFAFVRLARGPASTVELAAYLGMTKQSASQLVEQLVRGDYVQRVEDAWDGRVRRIVLTDRGWAAARAAEQATSRTLEVWRDQLGAARFAAWATATHLLADHGPLRPHG